MTDPRWLSEDEQRAWRRLAAVTTLLPAALDAQLQRDASLTHFAYFVVAMLSEAPGRQLRMSELAARSSSSPSRLSHTVARLESRGWVRRHRASEDGRGQVAELTGEGYDMLVRIAPGHVSAVRQYVFEALTPAQVGELDVICKAMLDRLDPDGTLVPPLPGDDRRIESRQAPRTGLDEDTTPACVPAAGKSHDRFGIQIVALERGPGGGRALARYEADVDLSARAREIPQPRTEVPRPARGAKLEELVETDLRKNVPGRGRLREEPDALARRPIRRAIRRDRRSRAAPAGPTPDTRSACRSRTG